MTIFLSASVPYGDRAERYVADSVAVCEAVRALVDVFSRDEIIVFGGHPAINPFVLYAAQSIGTLHNIYIFQSKYFDEINRTNIGNTENVSAFFNKIMIDSEDNNIEKSLLKMRTEMISQITNQGISNYNAAFFIGGMNGVDGYQMSSQGTWVPGSNGEYQLFCDANPESNIFPIASTEGAAKLLWQNKENNIPPELHSDLYNNLCYRKLFKKIKEYLSSEHKGSVSNCL